MVRGNRFIDLTGKVFERLTVIDFNGVDETGQAMWNCICECGNRTIVRGNPLRSGKSKSCGCLSLEVSKNQLLSRVGQKFGKLTIISKSPKSRKSWVVQCECGVIKTVLYGNLTSGSTVSCGCWKIRGNYQKDTSVVPYGESSKKTLINSYIASARDRGLSFNLNEDQCLILLKGNCYYCGKEPSQIVKNNYGKGDLIYNGIDRVDNKVGYEIYNVVSCCKQCNRAKNVMSEEEFISMAKRISERHK